MQFKNNSCVFDVMPNNFRCVGRQSDCCIVCPFHAEKVRNLPQEIKRVFMKSNITALVT